MSETQETIGTREAVIAAVLNLVLKDRRQGTGKDDAERNEQWQERMKAHDALDAAIDAHAAARKRAADARKRVTL